MNVEELLQSKSVPFMPKGKDYVVSCLNPEHDDTTQVCEWIKSLVYFTVSLVDTREIFLCILEKRQVFYTYAGNL